MEECCVLTLPMVAMTWGSMVLRATLMSGLSATFFRWVITPQAT